MESLNTTKVDFAKLLEVMNKGIVLVGEIQRQWLYLQQFFTRVATRVKHVLAGNLKLFVDYADIAAEEEGDKGEGIQLLIDEAGSLVRTAASLRMVSKTYVHISQRYITPRLNGLYKLGFKPSGWQQGEMAKLRELQVEGEKEIRALARKQREEYEAGIEEEVSQLSAKYDISPEEVTGEEKSRKQGKHRRSREDKRGRRGRSASGRAD